MKGVGMVNIFKIYSIYRKGKCEIRPFSLSVTLYMLKKSKKIEEDRIEH